MRQHIPGERERSLEDLSKENSTDFLFFGLDMQMITLWYGLFLVFWGFAVSLISASSSLTSYIPSLLGLPLVACGVIASKVPQKKKLIMHIAVLLGLVNFLGGLDFLRGFATEMGPFDNVWAGSSKLMLLITGLGFCILCVKSFMHARSKLDS